MDAFYPVIYLDALVGKVRGGAHMTNRAAQIAVGVDMDGIKHVLGTWVQATEGAKFWAGVCANLASRGVQEVPMMCCDGLTGFPRPSKPPGPGRWSRRAWVICWAPMRFASYPDRRKGRKGPDDAIGNPAGHQSCFGS